MCLDKNDLYVDLNRGDGICMYFDIETKLCTIYKKRPIICRVDDLYEEYFIEKISKSDYLKLNYEACSRLKKKKEE